MFEDLVRNRRMNINFVRALKIPNTGSHTIVWTHENTEHTGRNGYSCSYFSLTRVRRSDFPERDNEVLKKKRVIIRALEFDYQRGSFGSWKLITRGERSTERRSRFSSHTRPGGSPQNLVSKAFGLPGSKTAKRPVSYQFIISVAVAVSPDITMCGWLGWKHQLTNCCWWLWFLGFEFM